MLEITETMGVWLIINFDPFNKMRRWIISEGKIANTRSVTMSLMIGKKWVYTNDAGVVLLKEKAHFIIGFIISISFPSVEAPLQFSSLLNICNISMILSKN